MIPSDFNAGSKYARDSILAMIVGLQNGVGNDSSSERYQAYQEIFERIVSVHGDMFTDFKG